MFDSMREQVAPQQFYTDQRQQKAFSLICASMPLIPGSLREYRQNSKAQGKKMNFGCKFAWMEIIIKTEGKRYYKISQRKQAGNHCVLKMG